MRDRDVYIVATVTTFVMLSMAAWILIQLANRYL
jgi:hypothetical protein